MISMHVFISFESAKRCPLVLPKQNLHMVQTMFYSMLDNHPDTILVRKNEFTPHGKEFRMFSFSWFCPDTPIEFKIRDVVIPPEFMLVVSSPFPPVINAFVNEMSLHGSFRIGQYDVVVKDYVIRKYTPSPNVPITVTALSPITCYATTRNENGRPFYRYYFPGDREFMRLVNGNIHSKFRALYPDRPFVPGNLFLTDYSHAARQKARFSTKSRVPIWGSWGVYTFDGPQEYKQLLVDAGAGAKNNSGFGCVIPVEDK